MNILDDSAAGFTIEKDNVMATLYHPDAAANPNDTAALMNQFVEMMKGGNQNA
jgi:carbamoylphosphate synthase small subunit